MVLGTVLVFIVAMVFGGGAISTAIAAVVGGGVAESYIYPIYGGIILLSGLVAVCTRLILNELGEIKKRLGGEEK